MSEQTVQRLGVEFFGKLNEASITKIAKRIEEILSGKKVSDIFSNVSKTIETQLIPSVNGASNAVGNLGKASKDAGEKFESSFSKARTVAKSLTAEVYDLVKGFGTATRSGADLANSITQISGSYDKLRSTPVSLTGIADVFGTNAKSVSGLDLSSQGTSIEGKYNKVSRAMSEVVKETKALITLTDKLAESFAKIDFTNMIKPNDVDLFRSKFSAINTQVEAFTSALAKTAKPEFMGIQQSAMGQSARIDDALKSLSSDVGLGKTEGMAARIKQIVDMIKELRAIGGSALASEFDAGSKALLDFGVKAGMSSLEISKLNLGLLELNKVKAMISQQIENTKLQFDEQTKSTGNYDTAVDKLDKGLLELMKTEQSVSSVIKEKKSTLEAIIPVVGKLEAAFNKINMLDKISPPEIHKASEAWKAASSNLGLYMGELSNLMTFSPEKGSTEEKILLKSREIETVMSNMRDLSMSPNTMAMDNAKKSMQEMLKEYTALERTMLSESIDKTNASLKNYEIQIGDTYSKLRHSKLTTLELEKASELLKTQVMQLRAQYEGLGKITPANAAQAKQLATEWERASRTLDALNMKLRVNHGTLADASRGIRMYWEGFAPMLRSQAAWLTGGALLFGVMYKIQEAVKNYVSFEDRLNRIRIIGEGTTTQISMLRAEMLELAETTGQTQVEIAEAAFYLTKYGLTAKQVVEVLPSLARLTTVAGGTIQENVKGIIALINSYGMAYEDVDKLANALNITLNKSALEMADLSSILSTVASSGAQLNQPVEEILALSAAMSNLGVKSSTIGTSIRQLFGTLSQVEAPTERFAVSVLRKVSISLGGNKAAIDALNPSYHKLSEILTVLNKAGVTTHDLFYGLNLRAASGAASMINAKDSLLDFTAAIRTQNILTTQFEDTTKSADVAIKSLSSTLETTVAKILGGGTAEGLSDVARVIKEMLHVLGGLFEGLTGTFTRVTILAGGFLLLSKAVTNSAVSFTVLNGVLNIAPWMKVVTIILMIISALQLLSAGIAKYRDSQAAIAKANKEELEGYTNKKKELQSQIELNNELAESNTANKEAIKLKNAVLEREIELMREKERESQKAIVRETAGRAEAQLKKFVGESMDATPRGSRGFLFPGGQKPLDMANVITLIAKAKKDDKDALMQWLDMADEEDVKSASSIMQEFYKQRPKGRTGKEKGIISEEMAAHTRKIAELESEKRLIDEKNKATMESERIQSEISDQDRKLKKAKDDLAKPGTTEKEERKLKEEIGVLDNKRLALTNSLTEAKRKEQIATDAHNLAISKQASETKIINEHLERRLLLEENVVIARQEYADAQTQVNALETISNAQVSEKRTAKLRLDKAEAALLQSYISLNKETLPETERFHTALEDHYHRQLEIDSLRIDQSKVLTDKEKESQKLLLQRVELSTKILHLQNQLAVGGMDVSVQEAKQKQLADLANSLELVDMKYQHLQNSQKTFWDGITEYVRQTQSKLDAFWYNMGQEFMNTVEGMISEWGKFIAYQGVESAKEAKKSADERTSELRKSYDEQREELENSFATGQVTSAQYYEKLTDMNEKYNDDISKAQDDYNDKMKESQNILGNLWTKFWHKMVDLAIESLAQMAMVKLKMGLGSWWGGAVAGGKPGTDFGDPNPASAFAHSGGFINDLISGVKSYHSGGLNSNEVMAKVLKNEFVMNPRATRDIGLDNLYHMNKTGQMPASNINVYNLMDPASIPTLGPNDVLNIVSFDMERRGQIYKTMNKGR